MGPKELKVRIFPFGTQASQNTTIHFPFRLTLIILIGDKSTNMAYDEFIADRSRQAFSDQGAHFTEKKMMGGLCFLVDDKMCCGIHLDKKYGDHLLMARIGEAAYAEVITRPHCLPMDFTGRPMKGYVFVTPEGFDSDDQLAAWIRMMLAFNPQAKSSKKK